MIRVKTFTSQLRIFHAKKELDDLDGAVNDFIASHGVRAVVSVSDTVTSGEGGGAIGIIRVLAYEEPASPARDRAVDRMEKKLREWGDEIETLRKKADRLGSEARAKYQDEIADLRARQEEARTKLAELRKTGGQAWDEVRTGAEAALEEVKKGIEAALARLKKK